MVTIPLQQLEQGQTEEHHHHSTAGSGWSCGTEEYQSSFFLPMCLLSALRVTPEGEKEGFVLRRYLNKSGSADYPYNLMTSHRYSEVAVRVPQSAIETCKLLRESLVGRFHASMEEIMSLQVSVPSTAADVSCSDKASNT